MKWTFLILLLLFPTVTAQSQVTSWGYQLQNYDLQQLEDSDYDLLVMDYSTDGSDDGRFTSAQLDAIRTNDKILLCYISIGEAEDYRYYFKSSWLSDPPSWLDGENPDWEGNYKVKYWQPEWQQIIYGYIDRIIASGFDGLYLDIIDAYEFYEDSNSQAAQLMIDFVANISAYFKKAVPDGLIVPQNGERLLEYDAYRQVIDGIGREDLYVLPEEQERRDSSEIDEIESYLNLLNDSQLVLVVDYTDHQDLVEFAREQAAEQGYIHYIGVLELDELVPPDYSGRSLLQRWLLPVVVSLLAIVLLFLLVRKIRHRT